MTLEQNVLIDTQVAMVGASIDLSNDKRFTTLKDKEYKDIAYDFDNCILSKSNQDNFTIDSNVLDTIIDKYFAPSPQWLRDFLKKDFHKFTY